MKQVNSNFRDAKVGDKVYHVSGSVREIVRHEHLDNYPIVDDEGCRYDYDGRYFYSDKLPTIFTHPIKIIHADDMPVNPRIAEIESQIQRLKNELETLKEVGK
jgi:hypothetical protein